MIISNKKIMQAVEASFQYALQAKKGNRAQAWLQVDSELMMLWRLLRRANALTPKWDKVLDSLSGRAIKNSVNAKTGYYAKYGRGFAE